jgi:hypothetical protein
MITYDPRKDAYAILGVVPEATMKEVKKAYRQAALMWHPDKSPAPDAAERFVEVKEAASILRHPRKRREYDRLRILHLGSAAHSRRRRPPPPQPHAPLAPAPAWLSDAVRVHFDSVLLSLDLPAPGGGGVRVCTWLGIAAFVAAVLFRNIMLGALAAVFWAIARVTAKPPHGGVLIWAKVTPGRQIAEFHSLDQRQSRYERWTVPFSRLSVDVVPEDGAYRVEIKGFPRNAVPVLHRTRDRTEAMRRAREAGRWLRIPLSRAA